MIVHTISRSINIISRQLSLRKTVSTCAACLALWVCAQVGLPIIPEILPKNAYAEPASAEAIQQARNLSSAFEAVANQITPSVVSISAIKKPQPGKKVKGPVRDPFFDQFREFFGDDLFDRFQGPQDESPGRQGLGTGVVVDQKGHILTNNHVVGDADEVTVRLNDEREFKAEVVGKDPRSDIAVIKIKADKLVAANLGDSDQLKIGQWVIAAGNPFGLDNSITAGIVSAKGRSIMGGGQFEDFIQTDAAINPGNSGGPLVDIEGRVVGINTAIFSRSGGYMGIGFAIPINMAKNVMQSLITKGRVIRGWLGIGIQNLTEDLAKSFNYPGQDGALVGHVEAGGPAEKSGLKQGDIIVRIDGVEMKNINQLRNYVAGTEPGKELALDIIRDGRKEAVKVKVGELPSQTQDKQEEDEPSIDLGLSVETLSSELARRLGAKTNSGVIIRQVRPGGLGEHSGLQPRDIIVSVNGEKVSTVDQFYKAVEGADLKRGVRMVVESQGMERFVFLRSNDQ